jgi:hypothetical protein
LAILQIHASFTDPPDYGVGSENSVESGGDRLAGIESVVVAIAALGVTVAVKIHESQFQHTRQSVSFRSRVIQRSGPGFSFSDNVEVTRYDTLSCPIPTHSEMIAQELQPFDLAFQGPVESVPTGIPVGCVDRREFKVSAPHCQKPCRAIRLAGQARLHDRRLRTGHSTEHGHAPTIPEFPVAGGEDTLVACSPERFNGSIARCYESLL